MANAYHPERAVPIERRKEPSGRSRSVPPLNVRQSAPSPLEAWRLASSPLLPPTPRTGPRRTERRTLAPAGYGESRPITYLACVLCPASDPPSDSDVRTRLGAPRSGVSGASARHVCRHRTARGSCSWLVRSCHLCPSYLPLRQACGSFCPRTSALSSRSRYPRRGTRAAPSRLLELQES